MTNVRKAVQARLRVYAEEQGGSCHGFQATQTSEDEGFAEILFVSVDQRAPVRALLAAAIADAGAVARLTSVRLVPRWYA